MTVYRRLLVPACLGCLAMAAAQRRARGEGRLPNVIFMFTDDQRFDTVGALGNPNIRTPNLDRLAERSFVFRNAYNFGGNSGAVCIPSRNMAMTGKVYFHFDAKMRDRGLGPTFPKAMKAAGYETYYREKSGKANLPHIQKQFDHYADVHMVDALRTGYAARGIVNDAIRFITRDRDPARPFFMYLGFPCPHDPRWSAREFRELYDPAKLPLPPNYRPLHPYDMGMMTVRDECLEAWPRTEDAVRRHLHDYYSLISCMDRDIGRLLDALAGLGLADETLVVFSSDQGIALGSHGLMGKQNLYEDTQKVPMMFSGPGIRRGESDAFAYIHDIFPTVCELVGVPAPEGIDGRSLRPIIKGESDGVRDAVMLSYCETQRSIRDGRWKLIVLPKINRMILFDLASDPRETTDLSADPANGGVMDRLTVLLETERRQYGDRLPLRSENPSPAEFTPPAKWKRTPYPAGGLAPGVGGVGEVGGQSRIMRQPYSGSGPQGLKRSTSSGPISAEMEGTRR
jgi:arylsulfatase A-like enzyme